MATKRVTKMAKPVSEPKKLFNSLQFCFSLKEEEKNFGALIVRFHRNENHTVEEWNAILKKLQTHKPR